MYNFKLMLNTNSANLAKQQTSLSTVTCSSIDEYKAQLRKDGEYYIINRVDFSGFKPTGINTGDGYYDDLIRDQWYLGFARLGQYKNVTLDPSGGLVALPKNGLDSRALYASSPSTTKKILEQVAKKCVENYWNDEDHTDEVDMAPGATIKPMINHTISYAKTDIKNRTFSVHRTIITSDDAGFTDRTGAAQSYIGPFSKWKRDQAFDHIFENDVIEVPSYRELLTQDDCVQIHALIGEKHGVEGYENIVNVHDTLKEYLDNTYPELFNLSHNAEAFRLLQQNPQKYFVGPWVDSTKADYVTALGDMLIDLMTEEEFIRQSLLHAESSDEIKGRFFGNWWYKHIDSNFQTFMTFLKYSSGSQAQRDAMIRELMDQYVDRSITIVELADKLSMLQPELTNLADALTRKDFEVFETDSEFDSIAYQSFKHLILSNPYITNWFDHFLTIDHLEETGNRLIVDGEFLDNFDNLEEGTSHDDLFEACLRGKGFTRWIADNTDTLYPSLARIIELAGPDYVQYSPLMKQDVLSNIRSAGSLHRVGSRLRASMTEDDFVDFYEERILREIESRGFDPRDIRIIWDLEN